MPLLSAGTKTSHGRSSSIINISSIAGLTTHSHGQFNYGAAKAAFIHLTRSLAFEFKRDAVNVRVNS
jgi:NAD(P)-dependent dehydrogenase (short-subunit alcohol dehydrogenase family)